MEVHLGEILQGQSMSWCLRLNLIDIVYLGFGISYSNCKWLLVSVVIIILVFSVIQ